MNLESKIAELEKKLQEMSKAFSKQTAISISQSETISSQALKIQELERLLSQKAVRATSTNSHLPPSKDLTRGSKQDVKRNQSLREKATSQ